MELTMNMIFHWKGPSRDFDELAFPMSFFSFFKNYKLLYKFQMYSK